MPLAPPTPRPGTGSRRATIAALLALIALGLAWELWLAPTGERTLAVKVLPLLLPLPGLLRGRLYTFRWLSLMVWLYFIEGVVRAAGDKGTAAVLAALETALCLVLFAACAAYVRSRQRAVAAAAGAGAGAGAA